MTVIKIDLVWKKYLHFWIIYQWVYAFFFAWCDFVSGYILNNTWKKSWYFLFRPGWVNSQKELVLSKSLEQNFTCYLYKLCQSRLGFHHCVSVLLKWHTTKVMVVFQCNVFHPSLHSESSESNISETILDDPSLWSTQYSLGAIKICIHFIKCRHFGILITECVYFARD